MGEEKLNKVATESTLLQTVLRSTKYLNTKKSIINMQISQPGDKDRYWLGCYCYG